MHLDSIALALAVAASSLAPQATEDPPQVRVTGRAVVSVEPELAEVDVGVVTEAAEAQLAARQNAEKLDSVLQALRAALGPEAQFETIGYSLQPVYHYPEPRNQPVLEGYTASNTVRVKELSLDKVGEVIDTATAAGANSVHNIQFGLRDEIEVKLRALREAAADARRKAEALAAALGLQVTDILSVIEGEPEVVRPMPAYAEMAMAKQAGAPTPVEAGAIEFRASVTLVAGVRR